MQTVVAVLWLPAVFYRTASSYNSIPTPDLAEYESRVSQGANVTFIWRIAEFREVPKSSRSQFVFSHDELPFAHLPMDTMLFDSYNNTHFTGRLHYERPGISKVGFSLSGVRVEDGGYYRCVYQGENTDGLTSPTTMLFVYAPPSTPNLIVTDYDPQGLLTLTCTSECMSKPRELCGDLATDWSIGENVTSGEGNWLTISGDQMFVELLNGTRPPPNMLNVTCRTREDGSSFVSHTSEAVTLDVILKELEITAEQHNSTKPYETEVNQLGLTWSIWLATGVGGAMIVIVVLAVSINSCRQTKKKQRITHAAETRAAILLENRRDILRTQWEDGIPTLRPPSHLRQSNDGILINGRVASQVGDFGAMHEEWAV